MVISESVAESNDHNLIEFIAQTVEKLRDDMVTLRAEMNSTRAEMNAMRAEMDTMRVEMNTVRAEMNTMRAEIALIRGQMATKEDLARLDGRFSERLEVATKGIRGDLEQVHLRLDGLDRKLIVRGDRVESELSRLRSAVYLLGKNRPDVLRVLGPNAE
jgi:chromosome segregation ATPase